MSAEPDTKRKKSKSLEDLFKLCSQVFHPGLKRGLLLKNMDENPTDTGIQKPTKEFKSRKFTALRDIARELGATEEKLKEIYRNKNRTATMVSYIADLQVTINDTAL